MQGCQESREWVHQTLRQKTQLTAWTDPTAEKVAELLYHFQPQMHPFLHTLTCQESAIVLMYTLSKLQA